MSINSKIHVRETKLYYNFKLPHLYIGILHNTQKKRSVKI